MKGFVRVGYGDLRLLVSTLFRTAKRERPRFRTWLFVFEIRLGLDAWPLASSMAARLANLPLGARDLARGNRSQHRPRVELSSLAAPTTVELHFAKQIQPPSSERKGLEWNAICIFNWRAIGAPRLGIKPLMG